MVTQNRLKEIFTYDKSNGIFLRIKGTRKVGYVNTKGYIRISVDGKGYFAHHLAWLYVYGIFPETTIDHINNVRTDNSIDNLRLVSCAENSKNMKMNKNNKTGIVGVSWSSKARKWSAEITVNLSQIKLGLFTSIEDAINTRNKAEIKYNFHKNHGENIPKWHYISKMQTLINTAKKGDANKLPIAQLNVDDSIIKTFLSAKEAENELKISRAHIGSVCKGKRKTAGGFKWKYLLANYRPS